MKLKAKLQAMLKLTIEVNKQHTFVYIYRPNEDVLKMQAELHLVS